MNFKEFLLEGAEIKSIDEFERGGVGLITVSAAFGEDWLKGKFEKNGKFNRQLMARDVRRQVLRELSSFDNIDLVFTDEDYVGMLAVEQFMINRLIKSEEAGTEAGISSFVKAAKKFIIEKFDYQANPEVVVWSNELPSLPLSWDRIRIVGRIKKFSLSGADKKLDCRFLEMTDSHLITDGVLSLLKIKSLQQIFSAAAKLPGSWIFIVNEHLAGDRDILACQDDLIEAGHEELATL